MAVQKETVNKKKVDVVKKKKQKNLILDTVISRPLYSNGFKLKVYNTRKNMLGAIKNNYNARNFAADINDAAGVVFEMDDIWEDKKNCEEYKLFAIMYLNEEDIDVDIITHECTHAAFIHERNIVRYIGIYDGNDGTGDSPEERFCYTIGAFVDEVIKACLESKVNLKWRNITYIKEKDKKECGVEQ